MLYQRIPGLDKPISRIVFGTAIEPMRRGETPEELLDAVFESGVNIFDTAASYGESEVALGRWIASRGLRDQVTILTKGCRESRWRKRVTGYDLRGDFEDSLARLGVDFVELYLVHQDDPEAEVGPIVETLNLLRREGRVKVFGASNWSAERFTAANQYAREHGLAPFSVVSPAYSMAETKGSLNGESGRPYREWIAAEGLPVFAYSSLARGFLSGKLRSDERHLVRERMSPTTVREYDAPPNYERLRRAELLAERKGCSVPTLAMAWLLRQPLRVFPITSPGTAKHLEGVLQALELPLTDGESRWLNLEADAIE